MSRSIEGTLLSHQYCSYRHVNSSVQLKPVGHTRFLIILDFTVRWGMLSLEVLKSQANVWSEHNRLLDFPLLKMHSLYHS